MEDTKSETAEKRNTTASEKGGKNNSGKGTVIDSIRNLEISKLIALASILFYAIGFMITNLFLSAFGVVNFSLFRARYILSGLLFSGFIFLIMWPLYGFFFTYSEHQNLSIPRRIGLVISFSFYRYVFLLVAFSALLVFGSAEFSLINLFPTQPASQTPFWEVLFSSLKTTAYNSLQVIVIFIAVVVLVYVILLVLYPRFSRVKGKSRRDFLKETLVGLKDSSNHKFAFKIFVSLMIFSIVFAVIGVLFKFFGLENFSLFGGLKIVSFEIYNYFFLAFLIYIALVTWFLFNLLLKENELNTKEDTSLNAEGKPTDPIDEQLSKLYLLAWGILLLVPIYTFNIYPTMPQQLGGGRPIQVELIVSENISETISFEEGTTYLIDRYPTGGIFLFIDKSGNESVTEISGSELKGIIHHIPTPTPTHTPIPTPTPSLTASPQTITPVNSPTTQIQPATPTP